ncbi:MAG: S8 family serine peptidase [Myxococcota bacterium]
MLSRSLHSRSRRVGPALAVAIAIAVAVGAGLAAADARAQAGDPGTCGPFAPAASDASGDARAACAEPGLAPSASAPDVAGVTRLAAPRAPAGDATAIPGEALVAIPKADDGALAPGFALAPGAEIASSFWSPVLCATVARVRGPADAAPEALVAALPPGAALTAHSTYRAAAAEVRAFEPDAAGDPYRPHQYALTQLEAERAWARSAGAGATVALLDSLPEVAHRDLGRIVVAPAGDGERASDEVGRVAAVHGTLMAGVVGAERGNGVGIAGVAPEARVVAIPVCAPSGDGGPDACALYDVLRGIDAAWEAGANVLNLSLVGPSNPLLERAVARAERLGAVVVAAAGNEGADAPRYPAAYPSVLGVGAVDARGERDARSNRGLSVDVVAPGVEVLSTRPPDGYAFGDGTSLAAAHVSGAVAVLVGAGIEPAAARALVEERAAGAPAAAPRLRSLCELLARGGAPCPD